MLESKRKRTESDELTTSARNYMSTCIAILDFRTASEFEQQGHLDGALRMDPNDLSQRAFELPPKSVPLWVVVPDGYKTWRQAQQQQDQGGADTNPSGEAEDLHRALFSAISEAESYFEVGKWSIHTHSQGGQKMMTIAEAQEELRSLSCGSSNVVTVIGGSGAETATNYTQLCHGPSPVGHRLWNPGPFLLEKIEFIEHILFGGEQQGENTRQNSSSKKSGGGIALDLGCGSGRDMAFLANRGWVVTGIDNRTKLLRQAQELGTRFGDVRRNPGCGYVDGTCLTIRSHEEVVSSVSNSSSGPEKKRSCGTNDGEALVAAILLKEQKKQAKELKQQQKAAKREERMKKKQQLAAQEKSVEDICPQHVVSETREPPTAQPLTTSGSCDGAAPQEGSRPHDNNQVNVDVPKNVEKRVAKTCSVSSQKASQQPRQSGEETTTSYVKDNGNQQQYPSSVFGYRPGTFDLVVCVRFIHRQTLPNILALPRVGGFLLYSHFVDGVQHSAIGTPKTVAGFLLHNELDALVEKATRSSSGGGAHEGLSAVGGGEKGHPCWKVLHSEETTIEDGRPIVNFLCQRLR